MVEDARLLILLRRSMRCAGARASRCKQAPHRSIHWSSERTPKPQAANRISSLHRFHEERVVSTRPILHRCVESRVVHPKLGMGTLLIPALPHGAEPGIQQ